MAEVRLVEAVKDHALRNYTRGWDVVVECWSDEEIAAVLDGTHYTVATYSDRGLGEARPVRPVTSTVRALKRMREVVGPWNTMRAEIEATAF